MDHPTNQPLNSSSPSFDGDGPQGKRKQVNGKLIDHVLQILRNEYIVVGKTRVRAWHAWLLIGIAAGIAAGIILVANRSGEVEMGKAAVVAQKKIPSGMRLCGDNPSRQMLCSDSRIMVGGYGLETGFKWDGPTNASVSVDLCYGSGCNTPRCAGGKCSEVSSNFFAERAKYQGLSVHNGVGSGLYKGMKEASPYYRGLDYSRIVTVSSTAGELMDNNVAERYYFHYDPTNPSHPGPGCPQNDSRWDSNAVISCPSYNGSPGEPWVCQKRFNVAGIALAGGVIPSGAHTSNYTDPDFGKELVKFLRKKALIPDSYTGEVSDAFHFDATWIGEQWQLFGVLDNPPFTANDYQPCEAPDRKTKVNGLLQALKNIRQELDANIVVEINMTTWDSVHRDLLGLMAPKGTPPRNWKDWAELAYPPQEGFSVSDYTDVIGMDFYLTLPTGLIPGFSELKLSGKEWIENQNFFLTQMEKRKLATVLPDFGKPQDAPSELNARNWTLSSFLLWKGPTANYAPFNISTIARLAVPSFLANYRFKSAPGTLNAVMAETMLVPGLPLDTASHYDYFAGTGGVKSLFRGRGEKWGSCTQGETNCAIAEVDRLSLVGAYGRRFENAFVVVNNDPLRSAKINISTSSRYRYEMKFSGVAFLQTDGVWNKGVDLKGNPKECFYKGEPIQNQLILPPRSSAIIITSGDTVQCP